MRGTGLIVAGGALLALAACGGGGVDNQNAASGPSATEAAVPAEGGGVTREVAEPEAPAYTPPPTQAAIQGQPGPDGSQVELLSAKVTGDILTVTLRCTGPEKYNTESFTLDDISVIDDATSQRIAVLKDNDGKWLASNPSSDRISANCGTPPGILWAKFPAPPATSKTVSINLPQTAPFDGVPVTR